MDNFKLSFFVTLACLLLAFSFGGINAAFLVFVLAILEVSLSFDNAVVNASILKNMDEKWQNYFLTWGILVAVFGMRLIFPVLIVSTTSDLSVFSAFGMALNNPNEYSRYLSLAHAQISAFGGMFLMLVFLSFLFDEGKDLHWIPLIESKFSLASKLESLEIAVALIILFLFQSFLPENYKSEILVGGVLGISLYVLINCLSSFFEDQQDVIGNTIKKGTIISFIYLEVLDASFSFDGVLGAFAVTKDIVLIMLGLAIGASFVRSLTVNLVRKGTLDEYVFLEHGAHYAIGSLSFLMLFGAAHPVPEVVTALIGASFIALSLYSSVKYKKEDQAIQSQEPVRE